MQADSQKKILDELSWKALVELHSDDIKFLEECIVAMHKEKKALLSAEKKNEDHTLTRDLDSYNLAFAELINQNNEKHKEMVQVYLDNVLAEIKENPFFAFSLPFMRRENIDRNIFLNTEEWKKEFKKINMLLKEMKKIHEKIIANINLCTNEEINQYIAFLTQYIDINQPDSMKKSGDLLFQRILNDKQEKSFEQNYWALKHCSKRQMDNDGFDWHFTLGSNIGSEAYYYNGGIVIEKNYLIQNKTLESLVQILFHEIKHADQDYSVRNGSKKDAAMYYLMKEIIKIYEDKFGIHDKDRDYNKFYEYIPIEIDAEMYGNDKLARIINAFSSCPTINDILNNKRNKKIIKHESNHRIKDGKLEFTYTKNGRYMDEVIRENSGHLKEYPQLHDYYHPDGKAKGLKELLLLEPCADYHYFHHDMLSYRIEQERTVEGIDLLTGENKLRVASTLIHYAKTSHTRINKIANAMMQLGGIPDEKDKYPLASNILRHIHAILFSESMIKKLMANENATIIELLNKYFFIVEQYKKDAQIVLENVENLDLLCLEGKIKKKRR